MIRLTGDVKTSSVFPLAAPLDQGMNPSLLAAFQDKLTRQKINSCLVVRGGQCVFEYYRHRKIQSKPQKIYSITKSVISALVGMCLEQHLIPSLDTPILEFFPTFAAREHDARKRSITVDHLLTMTPGYHWPEFGEWNAFPHMMYAPHWVRFVLERSLEYAPGERMNYNSGASHLLTAIVEAVTGMKAAAFAADRPLRPTLVGGHTRPGAGDDRRQSLLLCPGPRRAVRDCRAVCRPGRHGNQRTLRPVVVTHAFVP